MSVTVARRPSTRAATVEARLPAPSTTLGPGSREARCASAVATTSSGLRLRAPAVASSVPTTSLSSVAVASDGTADLEAVYDEAVAALRG